METVRDKTIAEYETLLRQPDRAGDQITPRLLSTEYLQRYRETGDVNDILRAKHEAEVSLKAQPHGNAGADAGLASALIALHRFREALAYERAMGRVDSSNPAADISQAAVLFELGDYAAGKKLLDIVPRDVRGESGYQTELSRYEELTGDLVDARRHLNIAMREVDSMYDVTAERRAWYHFRAGELAFLGGDVATAIAQEHAALSEFPRDPQALNALARFYAATHDWKGALQAASQASTLAPLPETLGYEADAQAALGDAGTAAQTRDQIFAIEKIGNAYHISDRLLAVYYDDHDIRLADAYVIAKRELALRNDIYTEDTLAWAAAKAGDWNAARSAAAKATKYGTQDSRLWYHAGMIALHFGDRPSAKTDLTRALALNATFHPTYADDARKTLATL